MFQLSDYYLQIQIILECVFQSDLLVLSCDLVSNIDLTGVLNQFRQHDASLVTLFCHPTAPKVNLPTPGPKSKNKTGWINEFYLYHCLYNVIETQLK